MKKRNMIKKGLACVMAATMTIGLAACGGSNGGGDDVSEADFSDPESIKGTITVGGWPSGDDGFKAAMDGFNKEYPNIEVEWQFTDTTAHHQALQTSLSAGDGAPDVAMVEGAYVAQYRDSSALTNLLDEPYNAGELKDDFVAFKWDQCQSADGTAMRLIPWDVGPTTPQEVNLYPCKTCVKYVQSPINTTNLYFSTPPALLRMPTSSRCVKKVWI